MRRSGQNRGSTEIKTGAGRRTASPASRVRGPGEGARALPRPWDSAGSVEWRVLGEPLCCVHGAGLRKIPRERALPWPKREAPWQDFPVYAIMNLSTFTVEEKLMNSHAVSPPAPGTNTRQGCPICSSSQASPPAGYWDTDLRHHIIPAMNISATFSKR